MGKQNYQHCYNCIVNRLPEKLVLLRKNYKLSQDDVAKILNIDVASYMGIENGRKVLNYNQLIILSKYYGIPFEELFVNNIEINVEKQDNTSTDQINLEYFFKQNKWYRKILNKIEKSKEIKVAIIGLVIVLIIIASYILSQVLKPLSFDMNEMNKLSVGEKTVSYIDSSNRLNTTGSISVNDINVLSVYTGNNFVLELKGTGKVVSTGLNEEKTKEIDKLNNIEYITACDNHIIAINKLNKIYTIGENENGELDISAWKNVSNIKTFKNGTIGIDEKGYLIFTGDIVGKSQFKQYKNCLDYDANEYMTVVLKNDNTVDYSAYDDHYQYVTGWKDIVKVCCGKDFIAGLTRENTVLISTLDDNITKEVQSWKNIEAIDSSEDYLIAFDGKNIFGVGDNSYNQFEKKEQPKKTLQSINIQDLKVTYDKTSVTVSFEPIKNARGYTVSLMTAVPITYELKDYLSVTFNGIELENGKTYVVTVTALGEEGYENSLPVEYTFEYQEETNDEGTKDDENKQDIKQDKQEQDLENKQ